MAVNLYGSKFIWPPNWRTRLKSRVVICCNQIAKVVILHSGRLIKAQDIFPKNAKTSIASENGKTPHGKLIFSFRGYVYVRSQEGNFFSKKFTSYKLHQFTLPEPQKLQNFPLSHLAKLVETWLNKICFTLKWCTVIYWCIWVVVSIYASSFSFQKRGGNNPIWTFVSTT